MLLLKNYASAYLERWNMLLGLVFLFIVLVMPTGIVPGLAKLFNLRTDPFERADITSNTYWDWYMDHAFVLVPAQSYVAEFLATFKDYPQRQKAASFNVDEVLAKLKEAAK